MARRTKRKVEKSLMVVDTKREIIDILQITNRRFMYNPQTGILILGDEAYGKSIAGSHAQEFYDSQAGGCFDDYLRGWIGTSKSYPRGVIHFAPAVIMEQFDRGFDALQMFARLEGTGGDTVIRGFCRLWEERIGAILSASLGGRATAQGEGPACGGPVSRLYAAAPRRSLCYTLSLLSLIRGRAAPPFLCFLFPLSPLHPPSSPPGVLPDAKVGCRA